MKIAGKICMKFAFIAVTLLFQGCIDNSNNSFAKGEPQSSDAFIPPWQISGLRFKSGDIVDFAQVIYANGETRNAGDANRGRTLRELWFEPGEYVIYAEFGYQEPGVKYGGHLKGVLVRTNKNRFVYGGYPPSYFPDRYSEDNIEKKLVNAGFFLGMAFDTYGNHVGKAYSWEHNIPGYQAPVSSQEILKRKLTKIAIGYSDIVDVVTLYHEDDIVKQYGELGDNSIELYYYLKEDEYITEFQISRVTEGWAKDLIDGIFIKTNKGQEILGSHVDPRYKLEGSSEPKVADPGNYYYLGFTQRNSGGLTGTSYRQFAIPEI